MLNVYVYTRHPKNFRAARPGKCMQKYGAPTAHRVCEDCWFGHFVPGADHRCPGCVTGIPLPAAPPARSVEVYDEVL